MNDSRDFVEYTLIPAVWDRADSLFPEMQFKKRGGKWESVCHLNGERDSEGKTVTYIYPNSKFCIIDYSQEKPVQLIKWEMEREKTSDYWQAVNRLARDCGLSVPSFDSEEWKEYKAKQEAREEARETFYRALWKDTEEAREVREYLHGRKWTDEEIKKAGFGLVTTSIKARLTDAEELSNPMIGSSHRLVIPYLNGSRIFGFKFRKTDEEAEGPKYLNSTGLTKSKGLFGIGAGIADVTIVEGELDALHAQVKGASNVAATTGGRATPTQIGDAIKRGARKITLLYDNDDSGRAFILPTIEIAETFREVEVYVASLPDRPEGPEGYKDVDEFLGERPVEELDGIIRNALPGYLWKYYNTLDKYEEFERQQGYITEKQRSDFLDEIAAILNAPSMKPYNRERIFAEMAKGENTLQFDLEAYRAYQNEVYSRERAKTKAREVKAAYEQIKALIEGEDISGAVKLMAETAEKTQSRDKETEYARIFSPPTPRQAAEIIAGIKAGIPTGYVFRNDKREERLTLNSGLTFICGSRGHGKTSFLNNIALNEARRNLREGSGQSVLYFSYEVDKRRLLADLLNTFVNDRGISDNPVESIISHFKGSEARFFKSGNLPKDFIIPEGHFPPTQKPEALTHYKYFLREKDLFFRDIISTGALTIVDENYKVEELLTAIKYYVSVRPVSIVCIDYAQLLYSKDYSRQRTEEIKKVVNDIKDFANRERLPFVMAAQFNREVYSPVSVDTNNIGEGGDFERIADTIVGIYNLKELRPVPKGSRGAVTEEAEAKRLLSSLGVASYDSGEQLRPIEGKIFARLLKRRYGDYPIDIILNWEGRTKHIEQNEPPEAIFREPQQLEFNEFI